MEISNNQSWYINPNNRTVTSNIRNTAVKDWETVKETMFDKMEPVEDKIATLKSPLNLAERTSINKAANSVNIAIGTQIRINDGYVLTVKTHGVELSHANTKDYDPYNQEAYLKAAQIQSTVYSVTETGETNAEKLKRQIEERLEKQKAKKEEAEKAEEAKEKKAGQEEKQHGDGITPEVVMAEGIRIEYVKANSEEEAVTMQNRERENAKDAYRQSVNLSA